MSEEKDDRFWADIGEAMMPRRSSASWAAQRSRIMARLKAGERPRVRAGVVVTAAAAFAACLFLLRIDALEKLLRPDLSVRVPAWNARLTSVEGLVTVMPKGETEVVSAAAGMPIGAGDCILTGVKGRVELALSAESLIELGPVARLTVANLEERHTFIDLDLGTLVAKFHWDKSLGRRLEIRTPAAVAIVRGTEFGVTVAESGETSVAVFDEGLVAVRAKDAPSVQETMLEPRQEVLVPRGAMLATEMRQGQSFLRVTDLSRLQPQRGRVERMRERQRELVQTWKDMPRAERNAAQERVNRLERRTSAPQVHPQAQTPAHQRAQTPADQPQRAAPARSPREETQARENPAPQRQEKLGTGESGLPQRSGGPDERVKEFEQPAPVKREGFRKPEQMLPEDRERFLREHPELRPRVKELEQSAPGERESLPQERSPRERFLREHPKLRERIQKFEQTAPPPGRPESSESFPPARSGFPGQRRDIRRVGPDRPPDPRQNP